MKTTTMWAIVHGNSNRPECAYELKRQAVTVMSDLGIAGTHEVRKVSVTVLPKKSRKKAEVSR